MATISIGVTAAMSAVAYELNTGMNASGVPTTPPRRPVYVAPPEWKRHGTQPSYWSETWMRKERLADWDRVAGTVYEADDVEELIRHLDEAADAAQAD